VPGGIRAYTTRSVQDAGRSRERIGGSECDYIFLKISVMIVVGMDILTSFDHHHSAFCATERRIGSRWARNYVRCATAQGGSHDRSRHPRSRRGCARDPHLHALCEVPPQLQEAEDIPIGPSMRQEGSAESRAHCRDRLMARSQDFIMKELRKAQKFGTTKDMKEGVRKMAIATSIRARANPPMFPRQRGSTQAHNTAFRKQKSFAVYAVYAAFPGSGRDICLIR
jgi:hypothetical protein